jgi:hypothetical protein
MHRSHQCHIRQEGDDGFPRHLRQNIEILQVQTILNTSNRETTELAARIDIHARVVASPTFFDYPLLQMQNVIQAHVLHPNGKSCDALPMPPATPPWMYCV